MFLEINLENAGKAYVLYSLTTPAGELVHVGIVPFNQIGTLNDVPLEVKVGIAYLTIIKHDEDRNPLADYGVNHATIRNSPLWCRLVDSIKNWDSKTIDNRVECIETGEVFHSAQLCADEHGLTYTQLLRHLKGNRGHNTVKGKTYRRCAS